MRGKLSDASLVGIADFNAFHGFKGLPWVVGERRERAGSGGNRTLAGNIWRHAETKVVVTHTHTHRQKGRETCIDMQQGKAAARKYVTTGTCPSPCHNLQGSVREWKGDEQGRE